MESALREDDGADRAPQPDLDALRTLVAETRHTGLDVRLTESGTRDVLSAEAQATVYRIVQESLTNGVKQAPDASTVEAVLHCGSHRVRFSVTDDGRRIPPAAADRGAVIGRGTGSPEYGNGWRCSTANST